MSVAADLLLPLRQNGRGTHNERSSAVHLHRHAGLSSAALQAGPVPYDRQCASHHAVQAVEMHAQS